MIVGQNPRNIRQYFHAVIGSKLFVYFHAVIGSKMYVYFHAVGSKLLVYCPYINGFVTLFPRDGIIDDFPEFVWA